MERGHSWQKEQYVRGAHTSMACFESSTEEGNGRGEGEAPCGGEVVGAVSPIMKHFIGLAKEFRFHPIGSGSGETACSLSLQR